MSKFVVFVLMCVALIPVLLTSDPAYAYLDPGTGSMVLQAIVAGFLGSLFAVKMYWAKIVAYFRKKDADQ